MALKINIEAYNPQWKNEFSILKKELNELLQGQKPVIEHIGSTSVEGLAAKPIIDILVGLQNTELLDHSIDPLINNGYIYYQKYNAVMPYRRFFVKLKQHPENIFVPKIYYENDAVPNELHPHKLAHLHVMELNSHHWKRHIAFRNFLHAHDEFKNKYQQLKVKLSTLQWKDGNEYSSAKDDFIKEVEEKALRWYIAQKTDPNTKEKNEKL